MCKVLLTPNELTPTVSEINANGGVEKWNEVTTLLLEQLPPEDWEVEDDFLAVGDDDWEMPSDMP